MPPSAAPWCNGLTERPAVAGVPVAALRTVSTNSQKRSTLISRPNRRPAPRTAGTHWSFPRRHHSGRVIVIRDHPPAEGEAISTYVRPSRAGIISHR